METGLKFKSVLIPRPIVRTLCTCVPLKHGNNDTSYVPFVLTLSNRKKRLAQLYRQTVCLSLLWRIYSYSYFFHWKYYAQLAVMMQMNTALETQNHFQVGGFCSCSFKFLNFIWEEKPSESQLGFKILRI